MPRTRTDLIREVADLLNITQVGQTLSDDDAKVIRGKIDTTFARLARRNIAFVQNGDEIDDEFFDPLAVIVANNVGPKFGQSYDIGTDMTQEALLRSMQPGADAGETIRVEYF